MFVLLLNSKNIDFVALESYAKASFRRGCVLLLRGEERGKCSNEWETVILFNDASPDEWIILPRGVLVDD